MKRFTLHLSLFAVLTLLLAACVTAGEDPMAPVGTYRLAPGEHVDVPITSDTDLPLLYIELDRDIDLVVSDASSTTLAVARSASYFARNFGLLTASLVEPQIVVPSNCRGSCVILDQGTSSLYWAEITNNTGETITVSLYAFGDLHADENEPHNDSIGQNTPDFDVLVDYESGAIETLGDVDYWRVLGSGYFSFTVPNPEISLVLTVVNSDYTTAPSGGPFTTGAEVFVEAGEFLEIRAEFNDHAAVSANSTYYLESLE